MCLESGNQEPIFGMFKAIPVVVDETLAEEEEDEEVSSEKGMENFLQSMLKAETISMQSTARIDLVRSHTISHVEALENKKKKDEKNIAAELERKQKEVEKILKKKKEEEYLKRLDFEENRIKAENEKMKKIAEEKKKREEEDKRVQAEREELQINAMEREQQHIKAELKQKALSYAIKVEEERQLLEEIKQKEEELKIKFGREESFKEQRRKMKEKEKEETQTSFETVTRQMPKDSFTNDQLAEIYAKPSTEKLSCREYTEKENKNINSMICKGQPIIYDFNEKFCPEDINPIKIFRCLEKSSDSSEVIKNSNRRLQKPRLADENQIFRDTNNENSFSLSHRWQSVQTGHVRNKASSYSKPDQNQNCKSPHNLRKNISTKGGEGKLNDNLSTLALRKRLNEDNKETKADESETPWRNSHKNLDSKPNLSIVSVSVTPSTKCNSFQSEQKSTKLNLEEIKQNGENCHPALASEKHIPAEETKNIEASLDAKELTQFKNKTDTLEKLDETIQELEQRVLDCQQGGGADQLVTTSVSMVTQAAVTVR